MADILRQHGRRAVAVHSGETRAPRAQSLDELSEGRLDVICAVDVFNEGLDLPELDTVLMLRPTESRILWLQQFGRGLRKKKDDKPLTVIDYIGNHRTFLLKPQTLLSLPAGGQAVLNLLERAREGPIEIAPGCSVTYELETIDILRGLVKVTTDRQEALKRYSVLTLLTQDPALDVPDVIPAWCVAGPQPAHNLKHRKQPGHRVEIIFRKEAPLHPRSSGGREADRTNAELGHPVFRHLPSVVTGGLASSGSAADLYAEM